MYEKAQYSIDDIDRGILKHLQDDGRRSFSDIADDLGVTTTTVSNRVKKLIQEEILTIQGFIEPHRVGFNAPATIGIVIDPKCIRQAAFEISEFPEVAWAAIVSGQFDLIIEAMCRDFNHLTDLIIDRISKVDGVQQTQAFIQLEVIKLRQPGVELLNYETSREPLGQD
jgi:Lrp/AsnC family transcriptional regulator for asnA, asnC and gidA